MAKFLFRFFLLILLTVIIIIIFLSYIGIETDKFNDLIKNKANEAHQQVKLDFQETKIHLNLRELNLAVKLQNPKIEQKSRVLNRRSLASGLVIAKASFLQPIA